MIPSTRTHRYAAAALLLLCAGSVEAAAQEIRLPDRTGPFTLRDTTRYEQTALGIMYQYAHPTERAAASAYVYPVPAERLANPAEKQVAEEAAAFVAGFAVGIEKGWYSDVQLVVNEPHTFATADGPRPGHLVAAVFRREDGSHISFMHLVLLGGQYVKTRLTMPAEAWRNSTAPNFGPDLFEQLAAR
jgi:hypothetical protein